MPELKIFVWLVGERYDESWISAIAETEDQARQKILDCPEQRVQRLLDSTCFIEPDRFNCSLTEPWKVEEMERTTIRKRLKIEPATIYPIDHVLVLPYGTG